MCPRHTTADKYLRAANRCLDWILGLLDERGAIRGDGGLVDGYRKAPRVLAVAGRVTEAKRIVDFLRRTYASPSGDFNMCSDDPSLRENNTYRNAWLAWGLHDLGAFDLASATINHLSHIQHPRTGGLPITVESPTDDQVVEWGTTSIAIAAFVASGRLQSAVRAGQAMAAIYETQPDPEKAFYLCTDWSGSLMTHFADELSPLRVVRFGGDNNFYWSLGSGMAALVILHLATGEARWLKLAEAVFHRTATCRPDCFHSLSSPKIIWGTALLWSATNNDTYRQAAIEIADDFVERQTKEGGWVGGAVGNYTSLAEQPVPMSMDLAFDRSLWMYELARSLS